LTQQPYLLTYDNADDLFVLTEYNYTATPFVILAGQNVASSLSIEGTTLQGPVGMQFAGNALNILEYAGRLDRFQVSGTVAKFLKQKRLKEGGNCTEISIVKDRLLCGGGNIFNIYQYPLGYLKGQRGVFTGPAVIDTL
jgi:hypothetical protein